MKQQLVPGHKASAFGLIFGDSIVSQLNAPIRRRGGDLDVYTGLLFVAFLVLAAGVALVAMRNTKHSEVGNTPGGVVTIVKP